MQRKQFFCVLFTTLLLGLPLPLSAQYRSIVTVETVTVESPVGNTPRLPYQVWVKYADGKGEYRQVRWLNASNATEMAEANPAINPVGTEYKVRGFIIGDNTTTNGYPVTAQVKVVEGGRVIPVPCHTRLGNA